MAEEDAKNTIDEMLYREEEYGGGYDLDQRAEKKLNKLNDYQERVKQAIKKYGRIGAGLYDELDQAGLWVDDRNGSYVVKHK